MNTDAVCAAAAAETSGVISEMRKTSGACFEIAETPVSFFGNVGGAELYVKRDDLIPLALGGNKVRIAAEVFAEMERRGCDAVITYGSVTSNLNRAVALMAEKAGVKCYVIVKREDPRGTGDRPAESGGAGEDSAKNSEAGETAGGKLPLNYRLVLASGAEIVETDGAHVRETVSRVMAESRARGEKPFYVYGDETGHGNEEVLSRAYRKAYAEILRQEQSLFDGEYHFTEIFLAVGTGSTISGLIAACDQEHHITGISIARTKEKVLAATGPEDERFAVTDEYLAGGYGQQEEGRRSEERRVADGAEGTAGDLAAFCRETALQHEMPLDPVYTGKALRGTMEEILRRGITGKVLFIHTGGTPLYYDLLENEEK